MPEQSSFLGKEETGGEYCCTIILRSDRKVRDRAEVGTLGISSHHGVITEGQVKKRTDIYYKFTDVKSGYGNLNILKCHLNLFKTGLLRFT